MSKSVELLLTENVEYLGIVGDVVKVKSGYARNFLIPRDFATTPSAEKIAQLAERRAEAEKQVADLRTARMSMIEKLQDFELSLERTCNDSGLLYGSITQKDIADALVEAGFAVQQRDVRLGQTIKRIDAYEIIVRPEADLEAIVKLWVVSDRPLDADEDKDKKEGEAAEGGEGEGQEPREREPRYPTGGVDALAF